MVNLRDLKEVKEYDKTTKEREATLQELEAQASEYLETIEHRQSVEDHLLELERQYGKLESERYELRQDFSVATFENDFQEIERIHNERERLDNELAATFASIEETREYLAAHPLPVAEIAETIAAEYMLSKPSINEVVEALKAVHSEQASDIHSRRVRLSNSLRSYVGDGDIEQAKRRLSSNYDKQAEKFEQDKVKAQEWREIKEQLPLRVASKDRHQQEQYAREVLGVEV